MCFLFSVLSAFSAFQDEHLIFSAKDLYQTL